MQEIISKINNDIFVQGFLFGGVYILLLLYLQAFCSILHRKISKKYVKVEEK